MKKLIITISAFFTLSFAHAQLNDAAKHYQQHNKEAFDSLQVAVENLYNDPAMIEMAINTKALALYRAEHRLDGQEYDMKTLVTAVRTWYSREDSFDDADVIEEYERLEEALNKE